MTWRLLFNFYFTLVLQRNVFLCFPDLKVVWKTIWMVNWFTESAVETRQMQCVQVASFHRLRDDRFTLLVSERSNNKTSLQKISKLTLKVVLSFFTPTHVQLAFVFLSRFPACCPLVKLFVRSHWLHYAGKGCCFFLFIFINLSVYCFNIIVFTVSEPIFSFIILIPHKFNKI